MEDNRVTTDFAIPQAEAACLQHMVRCITNRPGAVEAARIPVVAAGLNALVFDGVLPLAATQQASHCHTDCY